MHDLIRDMGRDVVRRESVADPGERSRIWCLEDAIDVLTDKTGTKKIEGLILDLPKLRSFNTKSFKKMKRLRILQLKYVCLAGSWEYISKKLCWLHGREFPLSCIPADLHLGNLVALDMRYSKLKQFSEGVKLLEKLKFLNLNHTHELVETPNFEGICKLEKLTLKDCISLAKVHNSIGLLKNLVFLNLHECQSIRNLPGSIGSLIALENLNISGCSKLEGLPEEFGGMRSLVVLLADGTALNTLPDSFGNLGNLKSLNLQNCKSLKILPVSIGNLKSLETLNMSGCSQLEELPETFGNMKSLVMLDADETAISALPDSIGNLEKLKSLKLQDCKSLISLPKSIGTLRSLQNLNMEGCSKLGELPEELGSMESLVRLVADRTAISTLPETIGNLENLKILSLRECHLMFAPRKCPLVISVLPSSLNELDLRYCNLSDDAIPLDLKGLSLLQNLKLCGNGFTRLPSSIGSLPRLHSLWLNECKRLQYVSVLQASVMTFHARNCPLLESINLTNYCGNDLDIKGCHNLKQLEGYFNFETIGEENVAKLPGTTDDGFFIPQFIPGVNITMINILTKTHRIIPIQALCEKGIYSIFILGNEIPSWFSYQNEGDTISFLVPPLGQGSKMIGFIISAIYAWERSWESCYFFPDIKVINKSKMFTWDYDSKIAFFSSEVEQDIMWLSYWMFENNFQLESMDDSDTRWIFWNEMEEGDEINISIDLGYGIMVRKCGVHILYRSGDDHDSSNDLAFVSTATSRHRRRFLESYPRWLTINSNKEITSEPWVDSYSMGYRSWGMKRGERMMQNAKFVRHQIMDGIDKEGSSSSR